MPEAPFNGYAAIISDEPIPGVRSFRIYGPYETADEAFLAGKATGRDHGYLPIRRPEDISKENR